MLQLMRRLFIALALLAPLPAVAQTPGAELDKKLAKYDPAAVKAALHYAETFKMKELLGQSISPVRDAIVKIVKQKNPGIDEATQKEFVEVFLRVMYVDHADFFEKYSLVLMLDTFSTEEIVAIDRFYSSEVGRSMLRKMPQLMARLPEMIAVMQKEIVPLAIKEAQKALKAKGKNIRI